MSRINIKQGQLKDIIIKPEDRSFTDNSIFKVIKTPTSELDYFVQNDNALLNTRTTGITYGGDISISGATTFNVSAGVGQILDNTNPASPVYSNVIGKAGTNVPVINIANPRVYIYWDANGDIQQQLTAPTRAEYRTKLFLGRVTSNGTSLIADADDLTPIQQDANQIRDLAEFIGTIKKGLEISPNANLTFARTAGEFFDFGTNFHQNALDPHVRTIASVNPASFLLYKQDGFISSGNTNVPVTQYDVGGTLTTITNNRFVNHRIYGFQNGDVVLQYGQNQYATKTEAVNAITTAPFIISSDLATGVLLGVITFVKGETNLINSTITLTNRFGGIGGGVGASVAGAYLQILNNLSDVDNPDTARANIGAAALNAYNLLTGQQSFDSFVSFNSSTLRTGGTLVDDFPFLGTLLVLDSGSTSDLIINSLVPLTTVLDNDSKNRVLIIRNDSNNNHNIVINNIGSGTATNKFYIGENLTIPPKNGAIFMYRDEATGQDGWTLVSSSVGSGGGGSTSTVDPTYTNLGATPTFDLDTADVFKRTANVDITNLTFTNGVEGKTYVIRIKVPANTVYNLAYDYQNIETQDGIELILDYDTEYEVINRFQVELLDNGKYFVQPIYGQRQIRREYSTIGTTETITVTSNAGTSSNPV